MKYPGHLFVDLFLRVSVETKAGIVVQVFPNGQVFKQQVVLGDKSDQALDFLFVFMDVKIIDENMALINGDTPVQDVQQGGFADTAASHDGDQLSRAFRK